MPLYSISARGGAFFVLITKRSRPLILRVAFVLVILRAISKLPAQIENFEIAYLFRNCASIFKLQFLNCFAQLQSNPYPEMSGQREELINSRFANQRIFPYIFP